MDEERFYATFYCASITRCYPGKSPSGRGDRPATATEIELCRFWREWELRLLQPRLVVPIGGLAARELLRVSRVSDYVGRAYRIGEALAVPLPHPSGASGWLNDAGNRATLERALALLREAVSRLD